MQRRAYWVYFLGISLATLANSTVTADTNIQGIWSAAERTKGGLGSQWVFSKDGGTSYTFGALVDFRYKASGKNLSMTLLGPNSAPDGKTTVKEFHIAGNVLTIKEKPPGKDQVMRRAGSQVSRTNPIAGDWTYTHYTGGLAVMRFRTNKIVQLSVPFESRSGTYSAENGEIVIKLRGKESFRNKILVNRNSIIFIDKTSGKKQRFIKLKE